MIDANVIASAIKQHEKKCHNQSTENLVDIVTECKMAVIRAALGIQSLDEKDLL